MHAIMWFQVLFKSKSCDMKYNLCLNPVMSSTFLQFLKLIVFICNGDFKNVFEDFHKCYWALSEVSLSTFRNAINSPHIRNIFEHFLKFFQYFQKLFSALPEISGTTKHNSFRTISANFRTISEHLNTTVWGKFQNNFK